MGNVTARELRSIQDANRAAFAVWVAVPGAAEVAFDAAERVAVAGVGAAGERVEALELALRIVRELSGMGEGEEDVVNGLNQYVDVVRQLVFMLAALPSIHGAASEHRRHEQEKQRQRQSRPVHSQHDEKRAEGVSGARSDACDQFPSFNPYVGYRSDILGAIANMVYRRRALQDAVRQCSVRGADGLCVVLAHCAPDEGVEVAAAEGAIFHERRERRGDRGGGGGGEMGNPFLREWALFCVRNLTENNLENQEAIRQLEVQEAAGNKTMDSLGLRVDVDAATRRPVVVSADERNTTTNGGSGGRGHGR